MRIEGSFPTYSGSRDSIKNYYRFPNTGATVSSPIRMSTIDGTFYSVVYNPSSYSTKWVVYAPDGTRVSQDSDGQRLIDTNGNSVLAGRTST